MIDNFKLPPKGFVFWPVGTGDSSTIVVKEDEIVMQIDLHHMAKAEDDEESAWPIVDELERLLPFVDDKPFLSVFALTHPDEDHIRGFDELLKRVTIGEIWHTPRIFRDHKEDETLCADAEVFRKEVERRRKAIIKDPNNVKSGDNLHIIGHDDILNDDKYKDFPKERTSVPGNIITTLDEIDVSDVFEAFVHAPFKDDAEDTRNNTSLSLHVILKEADGAGNALFFGDREYETVKQIFDKTIEKKRTKRLQWDILLTPHHCSKKVMHFKAEGEEKETFKQDIMDLFEKYENSGAYIVVSADNNFTDGDGDNPPHKKARKRYEEIIDSGHFICTHEHPSSAAPEPIVFVVTEDGVSYQKPASDGKFAKSVAEAVVVARGGAAPPKEQVGFGI